jgi:hypothetical protein
VVGLVAAAVLAAAFQAPPQKFVPEAVQASELTVRLDLVGTIPTKDNPTSPTVAASSLLLIDQGGAVYLWNGARAETLLSKSNIPAGVKLVGAEPILNVAANKAGTTVYLMFVSSAAPKEIPKRTSPHDESLAWYLLYAFDFDGTKLTQPRPIVALQERVDGHSGGGMTVLPDDSVLFAAGDNGDSYEDGGTFSQDPSNHLAKLIRIDPATGQTTIVAVGVRACQRLTLDTFDGDARLTFVDPGGWVSEELDSIRVADLLGPAPANFGWGRSPRDGKSREGSFYLDTLGNSMAKAPADEPGFISPIAEVGREQSPVFAVSGPVHSTTSFSRITFLFADLVGGAAFATTGPPTVFHQPVMSVKLVDSAMQAITFKGLAGGPRPDPRFFNFPDGTAGVLLERTGHFYRLTEIKP